MLDIIRKVLALLSKRERRQLYLLAIATLGIGLLQMTSLVSIMPFLSVASNPSTIESNTALHWAYEFFGFTSTNQFLFVLGLAVLALLLISNTFIATVTWLRLRYVWMRNYTLSRRLLHSYLDRPYSFFLGRNSADLSKNILSEIQQVIVELLMPGLQLLASVIVALLIVARLFVIVVHNNKRRILGVIPRQHLASLQRFYVLGLESDNNIKSTPMSVFVGRLFGITPK